MKYVCEKCNVEFEDASECSKHERVCGLPESDVCKMHLFEILHDPICLTDTFKKVPYSTLAYSKYVFDEPWEDYNGDFLIRVEDENKNDGLKKLFEFALGKTKEKLEKLQDEIKKIKELQSANEEEEK